MDLVEKAATAARSYKDLTNMFQLFTEQKQLFSSTSIKLDDLIRVRNKVAPQATDQQVR